MVYSKAPFKGVERVIEYLGRYSHRTAISNAGIKGMTDTAVMFDYKDYRDGGKHKMMTLTGEEFVHRFSRHILPAGFVRIRHYGFLGSMQQKEVDKHTDKDESTTGTT